MFVLIGGITGCLDYVPQWLFIRRRKNVQDDKMFLEIVIKNRDWKLDKNLKKYKGISC
jgi:hypothetical protein